MNIKNKIRQNNMKNMNNTTISINKSHNFNISILEYVS